jgi:hypothetical protein
MTAQRFVLTAENGDDMTAEIDNFANCIGLERAAPSRYSKLLVLGLFGGWKSGRLNPAKVMHEINALEGIGKPSQLKPPIMNKHPPLKGLWHKHYLEDGLGAVSINIGKGLKKYGLPLFNRRIKYAQETGEELNFYAEDIPSLVNDVVSGNWMRLVSEKKLTGEWIIYAQHNDKNYYLCLCTHENNSHDSIRQQIDAICCQEFPFLSTLLANA